MSLFPISTTHTQLSRRKQKKIQITQKFVTLAKPLGFVPSWYDICTPYCRLTNE